MANKGSRSTDRKEIQWTTGFLENSPDPLHQELLYLLTQGNRTGTPIKEGNSNAQ